MREYFDKQNGIVWIDFFNNPIEKQPSNFIDHIKSKLLRRAVSQLPPPRQDIPDSIETLREFDRWTSHPNGQGIRDYVTISKKSKEGMGSYFFNKYLSPTRERLSQHENKSFHLVTGFRADKDGSVSDKTPIGTVLLSHENYEAIYKDHLEYIVVNPDMQGRGVGTKMLESMSTNLGFFTGDTASQSLVTYIKNSNKASIRLFANMGFKKYTPPYIEGMTDNMYNSPYSSYIHNDFAMAKNKKIKTM